MRLEKMPSSKSSDDNCGACGYRNPRRFRRGDRGVGCNLRALRGRRNGTRTRRSNRFHGRGRSGGSDVGRRARDSGGRSRRS